MSQPDEEALRPIPRPPAYSRRLYAPSVPSIARPSQAWPLRVVSWNLAAAHEAGAIDIQPPPRRVWRHTFGAEIRPASRARFDVGALDADVVLIQGVRLLSHVRLLFPASRWRVVVSRQLIRPVLAAPETGPGWGNAERTPTTAIAIRYQRGVRIAGQEHITGTAIARDGADGSPGETAASLAVRLRIGTEVVWLVSAELPQGCTGFDGQALEAVVPDGSDVSVRSAKAGWPGDPACAAQVALAAWWHERPRRGRLAIGGAHTAGVVKVLMGLAGEARHEEAGAVQANGTAAAACPKQSLGINGLSEQGMPAPRIVGAKRHPDAGCLSRLDIASGLAEGGTGESGLRR